MLSLIVLMLAVLSGSPVEVSPVRIPRVTRPPKFEDFLQNRPREAEAVVTEFLQMTPGDGEPVSQPTTAYLSYDDHQVYVVFVCKDDPKLIRARMSKRENVVNDDRVSVGFDTFHDHRRAYWFDLNPYNIQGDGVVIDGVEDSADWDAVWRSHARIVDDGYVVLYEIPFNMLRFSGGQGPQTWGLFLARFIQRNNEWSCWPHISKRRPGWVQQSGDMIGLEDIAPGRNVQLIPYGFFSRGRYWGGSYRTENEPRAGLDAKAVIKEAFTLDVALNPDFSQVESDEPQVTVNQRFEVLFPERRPFFLENGGMFRLPQRLFFSRRIIDPQFGARLTGKVGRWSLGMLGADDEAPGATLAASDSDRGKRALNGVFRLQREFDGTSTIGLLATTRSFGSGWNRVAGLDAHIRVLPNWFLSGQAVSSETQERNGKHLVGPSCRVGLEHNGRHLRSTTTYSDISPSFRAELGYIPRVDIRQFEHLVGYDWRPEGRAITSWGPRVQGLVNRDRAGRVQDWQVTPTFGVEMKGMTYLTFSRTQAFELYANHGFRRAHTELSAKTQWLRWLGLNAVWRNGTGISYYPAAGLAPSLGNSTYGTFALTLIPVAQMRLENSYIHSSLRSRADGGASLFANHIVRSKTNYQFTPALSLRAIIDYNAVLPDQARVNLNSTKHLGMDFLLTYMLHPGTALHVGYTDMYDNLALDPAISPAMRRTSFPDFSTGRQFFVKLSYRVQL